MQLEHSPHMISFDGWLAYLFERFDHGNLFNQLHIFQQGGKLVGRKKINHFPAI